MSSTLVLQQHPTTLLGVKLTATQQVLFCFLVPAIANCIIYIIDFASNVAVVERHFEESNVRWAISTLIVLYIPSFVYFTLTVSNIEKWNEQTEKSRAIKWFLARLLQLVAFPIYGIYRYAKIIFWSIEAFYQSGIKQEEALKNVSKPSYIELYLFLQAFLQGLPQAALQLFILFSEHSDNRETDSMQVLCIASSLMIVATTTVSFQRFESQRSLGRNKPWGKVLQDTKTSEQDRKASLDINIMHNEEIKDENTTPNKEDQEHKSTTAETNSEDEDSTPYLQPRIVTQERNASNIFESSSSSSSQSLSYEDNLFPIKTETETSEQFSTSRLPLERDFQTKRDDIKATNIYDVTSTSTSRKPLELPTRRIATKGLEHDEITGKTVSFLMWFLFLTCRILALVSFTYFYPWPGFVIILLHFMITLLITHKCFHIIPTIYTPPIIIKIYLAFIFCFCLIEFNIKFNRIYLIYTTFFITTSIENIVLNTSWYLLAEWDGWWYNYTYFLFWGCQLASLICSVMYFHAFKPKSHIIYNSN